MALRSIVDEFVCGPSGIDPGCPFCDGTGTVCEDHPERPWHGTAGEDVGCPCHQAGMPCKDGRKLLGSLDGLAREGSRTYVPYPDSPTVPVGGYNDANLSGKP